MPVSDDYLQYPKRRRGMDHDRYTYSPLPRRQPVLWPGGARVALWIVPTLEVFPLDMIPQGVKPPGGLDRPYPDYWNYTLRDYGNRVGAARIFRALESRGLKATVAMSARLAGRYPRWIAECNRHGHEIAAHGLDMGHIHAGELAEAEEQHWVREAVTLLREASGQAVVGWSSPAGSQTWRTLDLVSEAGCAYVFDWANDDMPYRVATRGAPLVALPNAFEVSDLQLFHVFRHEAPSYVRQFCDHFDALYDEAGRSGGRIVALSVRPWVSGVPHRIAALEAVLDHILAHAGVWNATGAEIVAAWLKCEATAGGAMES